MGKKIAIIVLCVFIIVTLFLNLKTGISYNAPEAYYGIPAISTDYPNPGLNVMQVVDDGSYVYILYTNNRGIVQVCDLSGNYRKTIFFYSHMNGGFTLAVEGNTLYVRDERSNVYTFVGGEFDSFLEKQEADKILSHIEFVPRQSFDHYEVKGGSVWRVLPEGKICILKQSKGARVATSSIGFIACITVISFVRLARLSKKDGAAGGSLS